MCLGIPDSYDAKIAKNLQPLDILACYSANKPFQNPTLFRSGFSYQNHISNQDHQMCQNVSFRAVYI